ncbi:TniQ protein [Paenibacillus sophorae]|uniref:TniQ protein n=1 Tax=Paenibacillus sophorae TaxID=1333845 RepID=A0A1H8VWW4_9BACL|nr:TnsD family Tn7-like transposition protein [Paenibacillus sophorae]QWU15615.1 TnsD family transposase [Paenibacillus sophorae]SEP19886.1 TniQ protein [Paenibacillus sophorae]
MNTGKLSFFPTPYPDEDFRSIIHRYHLRSINMELHESKLELLGLWSSRNTDFPHNLAHLLKQLPQNSRANAETFINNHTLFPLFRPFLSKARLHNVREDMLYGATTTGANFAGRLARNNISHLIRYCPRCLIQDYEKYGEVYVHRIHQLKFFNVCPSHGTYLITHCPECSGCLSENKAMSLLSAPICPRGHKIKIQSTEIKNVDNITEIYSDIQYLLNNPIKIERENVTGKLREACWEHGYYTYSGRLTTKLGTDFLLKYSEEVLTKLGLSKSKILSTKIWREMIGENDRLTSIVLYILMMRIFSPSIEDFFERKNVCISNPIPFGNGPWRCMNKLCDNYQNDSFLKINRSDIISSIHYIHFFCSKCQMEFTARWDWKNRRIKDVSIRHMGKEWENKVLELYIEGLSNTKIAAKVYSSTNLVRICLIKQLGQYYNNEKNTEEHKEVLKQVIEARNRVATASEEEGLIIKYREMVLNTLKEAPFLPRSQISKKLGRYYTILMRYDRNWLNEILPSKKKPPNKLNYELVDQDLSIKVRAVAERLRISNPPTQIKKYSILNVLESYEKHRILKHGSNLPQTTSMIEKYMETKEDYLIRHVPSIVSQLKASGYRNPTFQSIVAFRRSYRNLPERTQEKIKAKLLQSVD